jgi:hypothetical protein
VSAGFALVESGIGQEHADGFKQRQISAVEMAAAAVAGCVA